MSLAKRSLSLLFLTTLLLSLFMPVLAPRVNLLYFAPFLIVSYYQKKLLPCLWYAAGCGLILDILSSEVRIGFFALSFSLTTLVLYQQKQYFFADNASTLPIMTYLFSALATAIHMVLAYALAGGAFLSAEWIVTDLVFLPIGDAAFAFLAFAVLPRLVKV